MEHEFSTCVDPGGTAWRPPPPCFRRRRQPLPDCFFAVQCGLCHSAEPNDNGGAQGPNLLGVLGRKAAALHSATALRSRAQPEPGTTPRGSFPGAPTTAVPGTSHGRRRRQQADRENLLPIFTAVRDGTMPAAGARGRRSPRGAGVVERVPGGEVRRRRPLRRCASGRSGLEKIAGSRHKVDSASCQHHRRPRPPQANSRRLCRSLRRKAVVAARFSGGRLPHRADRPAHT